MKGEGTEARVSPQSGGRYCLAEAWSCVQLLARDAGMGLALGLGGRAMTASPPPVSLAPN